MLFRGVMITSLSGSVDGAVASHNRGGAYFRERVVPVDPNTERQQLLREAMGAAATQWSEFTPVERAAWMAYARTVQRVNRIGDPRTTTGRAEFTRRFVFRYQAKHTYDPTLLLDFYPPGPVSDFAAPPTAAINGTNTGLIVTWQEQGFEENEPDVLSVYASLPVPPTVYWFRGPYQLIGGVIGGQGAASDPPQTIDLQGVVPNGQRIFWRVRLSRAGADLGRYHAGHADANVI